MVQSEQVFLYLYTHSYWSKKMAAYTIVDSLSCFIEMASGLCATCNMPNVIVQIVPLKMYIINKYICLSSGTGLIKFLFWKENLSQLCFCTVAYDKYLLWIYNINKNIVMLNKYICGRSIKCMNNVWRQACKRNFIKYYSSFSCVED